MNTPTQPLQTPEAKSHHFQKFKTADERYKKARAAFSEKSGPREIWNVIDHWPLYCGIQNLERYLANVELVKSILHVPGHIAEFGSWRGANLMLMAKTLRVLAPGNQKMLHCFDSFQGLTEFVKEDAGKDKDWKNTYKGSYEELKEMIELYEMQDEIVIHKGLIENTLTPLIKQHEYLSFSMVYCDTDLYSSTQLILKELHPRLVKGGIFVFDEWNYEVWPGEGVAANEFMKEHGSSYQAEQLPNVRSPSLILRKIRD